MFILGFTMECTVLAPGSKIVVYNAIGDKHKKYSEDFPFFWAGFSWEEMINIGSVFVKCYRGDLNIVPQM